MTKLCPVCQGEVPPTKQATAIYCSKKCAKKAYDIRYREKNPEKAREIDRVKSRRWRTNNLEKARELGRKAADKHNRKYPEKVRERHSQYYKNNKEKVLEMNTHWAKNNPEKVKEISARCRNNNREKYREHGRAYHRRLQRDRNLAEAMFELERPQSALNPLNPLPEISSSLKL